MPSVIFCSLRLPDEDLWRRLFCSQHVARAYAMYWCMKLAMDMRLQTCRETLATSIECFTSIDTSFGRPLRGLPPLFARAHFQTRPNSAITRAMANRQ